MNATIASAAAVRSPVESSALPVVEREDIAFYSPQRGRLLVEITFRNPRHERTQATFGLLRSAPLGVFLPWRDLGFLQVPTIEPRESVVIRDEYEYEFAEPLGSIDKMPPEHILTKLGAQEPGRRPRRTRVSNNPPLATDLLTLMSMGSVYWAGNLNVFFPGADVERHCAMALRIYPGRLNLSVFVVGAPRDHYRFELSGDSIDWNPRLHDSFLGLPTIAGIKSPAIREGAWHQPASGMFLLALQPPPEAEAGAVNVHVRQKSTGREAVVEFTMDATAEGPGCYKL